MNWPSTGFSNVFAQIRIAVMRKWNWERGATAVEYGLFVAFIAAVVIFGVTTLGLGTSDMFVPVLNYFEGSGP